jgi:hypothetical protein
VNSSGILENGSSFSGLNFFGKIIINTRKPSTECENGLMALPFQGIELCKL